MYLWRIKKIILDSWKQYSYKNILLYLAKLFVFLLLVFAMNRLVFLTYNISNVWRNSLGQILLSFYKGLRLDISSASYILIIPIFLLFIQSLLDWKGLNWISKYYFYLILIIISAITSFELGLYDDWGSKLNYKALSYLAHPGEVVKTASVKVTIISLLFFAIQMSISLIFYKRYVYTEFIGLKRNWFFPLPFLILGEGFMLMGLRGGVQQIPVSLGAAYYSKSNDLNSASMNSFWYCMNSIYQNKKFGNNVNPYNYYSPNEAKATSDYLHSVEKDTTLSVLNSSNPNIVLIVLESWTDQLIESLGGEKGITPDFDKLSKEGIVFSNLYASGERSNQGMNCIFSGFPAQPTVVLISQSDKFQKQPFFVNPFHDKGYQTSFSFGGDLNYGNIKGYFMYNKFDEVKDEAYFSTKDYPQGKLGIHDEFMLAELMDKCNSSKAPFFNCLFTLSSHSPYDQPLQGSVKDKSLAEYPFLCSANYTDKCLGDFFEKAKKQTWYKNTLFVLVADHGHITSLDNDAKGLKIHHCPMLWLGDVIKPEFRGYKYDKIASQNDLASTLLAQLNMDKSAFKWSKNLFNPYTKEFAYVTNSFPDGWGFITPNNGYMYECQNNSFYLKNFASASDSLKYLKEGKCYMQQSFQEYLDY